MCVYIYIVPERRAYNVRPACCRRPVLRGRRTGEPKCRLLWIRVDTVGGRVDGVGRWRGLGGGGGGIVPINRKTDETGDNRAYNKCPLAAESVHCVYRAAITPRARSLPSTRSRPHARRVFRRAAATDGQDNAQCWRRINRRRRRRPRRPRPR